MYFCVSGCVIIQSRCSESKDHRPATGDLCFSTTVTGCKVDVYVLGVEWGNGLWPLLDTILENLTHVSVRTTHVDSEIV